MRMLAPFTFINNCDLSVFAKEFACCPSPQADSMDAGEWPVPSASHGKGSGGKTLEPLGTACWLGPEACWKTWEGSPGVFSVGRWCPIQWKDGQNSGCLHGFPFGWSPGICGDLLASFHIPGWCLDQEWNCYYFASISTEYFEPKACRPSPLASTGNIQGTGCGLRYFECFPQTSHLGARLNLTKLYSCIFHLGGIWFCQGCC